jgi:hypothetical protein
MHPRTEELLRHLDTTRGILSAAVDTVPSALRETQPAPDRWSVANVLEHLTRVEEQITRLLAKRLADSRDAGALPPETRSSSVLESIDQRLLLDRTRRITSNERSLPTGTMDSAAAMAALEHTRAALRELVISYDGMDLSGMTFPHPALGMLDGYGWFAFIGMHEARHAAQIREIASSGHPEPQSPAGRADSRSDP